MTSSKVERDKRDKGGYVQSKELTQAIVEEWIKDTDGWWTVEALDRDLNIKTATGKTHRRQIVRRLFLAGLIQRYPGVNGKYRLVVEEAPLIKWEEADTSNIVDLKWAFGLEKLVTIYPKNLIVVAGTFNAGKTAFCLDFIWRNMHSPHLASLLPIVYFTSEMGEEELKLRLRKFPATEWAFEARERSFNFPDVIRRDRINVIDYLKVGDNFWQVGDELEAIKDKLGRGVALIALQKKRGAEFGRGAEFSLELPRLYLAMDNNLLRIVKGKNWAVQGQNPNERKFSFQLVDGCKFVNIKEEV